MRTVLTIAGSDCSGGAGIQADLKTMTAHKVYGMSVVTALTAQNTTGVYGIMEVTPEFLGDQLDCIFNDIYPDAVQIGMLADSGLIHMTARKLREYGARRIVLVPLATVITPNIPEAEVLSGMSIGSPQDMEEAARKIGASYQGGVLIKGGHQLNDANDFLYTKESARWFRGERIENPNTHGTGCTLSSAIASNLALGCDVAESVRRAKNYISGALRAGLDLGKGSGPMDHCFEIPENDGEWKNPRIKM